MHHDKDILIKYSIEKAEQALQTAIENIDKDLVMVNNRTYYSIFYIVLALSYLDGFTTADHHQLMGWFNKIYIHENEIFEKSMGKFYSQIIRSRKRFDYDVTAFPEKETCLDNIEKAKIFVQNVKEYIVKKSSGQGKNE